MKLHMLSGAIQIKTNCLKKLMKALKKSCGRILEVRQFLYYGVRVPTTRNNKNSEADKYLLRYFGTLEGTSSKHTPCLNNFAEQNRNKHFVCFSSPHKVFDFVGTPK